MQITRTTPFRRMMRQFSHMRRTELRTFIFFISISGRIGTYFTIFVQSTQGGILLFLGKRQCACDNIRKNREKTEFPDYPENPDPPGKHKKQKKPAASYSRTSERRTTLGDGALDFRVRYGNGYYNSSMATGIKPFELDSKENRNESCV